MKKILLPAVIAAVLIGGAIAASSRRAAAPATPAALAVARADGKQVIEILAKGGYTPEVSRAKAGVPTVLKLKTDQTYDCSAGISIPSGNFQTALGPSQEVDVAIPPQPAGTTIEGICAMGMYHFEIHFE